MSRCWRVAIIIPARLPGIAAKRLGQPPVLGEILAGIRLGSTVFPGRITTTLFTGTAMAATAFLVLARIPTNHGLHRTRTGGLALASAAVADFLHDWRRTRWS